MVCLQALLAGTCVHGCMAVQGQTGEALPPLTGCYLCCGVKEMCVECFDIKPPPLF